MREREIERERKRKVRIEVEGRENEGQLRKKEEQIISQYTILAISHNISYSSFSYAPIFFIFKPSFFLKFQNSHLDALVLRVVDHVGVDGWHAGNGLRIDRLFTRHHLMLHQRGDRFINRDRKKMGNEGKAERTGDDCVS